MSPCGRQIFKKQNRQTFSAPQNKFVKILQKAVLQEAKTQSAAIFNAIVQIQNSEHSQNRFKRVLSA
jgi:G:T/U-mismatch repair DNA glycosylase